MLRFLISRWNLDLLEVLLKGEGLQRLISIYPFGFVDICGYVHANPSNAAGRFRCNPPSVRTFWFILKGFPADWFNLKRVVLRSKATYNQVKDGRSHVLLHVLKVFSQCYFSKVLILLFIFFFLPFSLAQTPRASNSQCCGDTLLFSSVNTKVIQWYRHWWSVMTLKWRSEEKLRGEMSRNHKDVQLT